MKFYQMSVLCLVFLLLACNGNDTVLGPETDPIIKQEEEDSSNTNDNTNIPDSNNDSNNDSNTDTGNNSETSDNSSTTDTNPPSDDTFTGISIADAVSLVNNIRTQGCRCGNTQMPPVAPITWNNDLAQAARSHSNDMYTNHFFDHWGSNGSTPGDRISASGYDWYTYGENIAYNYPSLSDVIDGWIDSPSHCKNIMNADFKEMGVAKVGSYWTQTFAASR